MLEELFESIEESNANLVNVSIYRGDDYISFNAGRTAVDVDDNHLFVGYGDICTSITIPSDASIEIPEDKENDSYIISTKDFIMEIFLLF